MLTRTKNGIYSHIIGARSVAVHHGRPNKGCLLVAQAACCFATRDRRGLQGEDYRSQCAKCSVQSNENPHKGSSVNHEPSRNDKTKPAYGQRGNPGAYCSQLNILGLKPTKISRVAVSTPYPCPRLLSARKRSSSWSFWSVFISMVAPRMSLSD